MREYTQIKRFEFGSHAYSVKQFKFFNPDDTRYYWDDLVEGPAGRRLVELHTDPFYAECRAYGRIHQEKQRGTLTREVAIPCFGFIYLGDEHRPMLEQSGVELEEDCLDDELSQPEDHPQHPRPIRAIVKKLASSNSGLNNKGSVGRMLKSIKELNRLQIYNKDIRKDNFRDEKLVDFGSSWTEPHCFMGDSNILNATDTRIGDLVMFDEMVDMEGIFAQWRAMPNWPYKKKLRSHAKRSNNR